MPSLSFLKDATLVMPAGGKGERIAALAEAKHVNKAVLKVGGMSLIARTLGMYARAGVKRVVVLVFHRARSVEEELGNGSRFGVSIRYSMDPKHPIGKGGAIRLAIERGHIPVDKPMIIHNPDDQVVGIDARFPGLIMGRHRAFERRGCVASAVCVPWTQYAYSAFKVRRGKAVSAVMYPKVFFPTHIGVTVFSAGVAGIFRRLIDLKKKVDFESVVLPRLAARGRLGVATIPTGAWIAVNDLKGYLKLLTALGIKH